MYKYGEVLLKSFIFFTILIFLYFLIQNIFFYDMFHFIVMSMVTILI